MTGAEYLYRRIVFQAPERAVHPPSWLEHTPFAFWMTDALRPAVFVELGCHSGNSYSSFAQAVQALGLTTACYAVDTWRGDPHAGGFDESVFTEWADYHDRRFSSFSRLIRSTFDQALEHFSDGSIDLLHIDGYHTFDATAHTFETWRPKMSARGVVLCHDINVRERDFGAWRLWERLAREHPSFEFRHGHGLGVLGIGRDLPDPLRWLFSLDAEGTDTVRMFFARLGAAVLAQYAASDAQRAVRAERTARNEQTLNAARDLEVLKAENSDLREALKAAEEGVALRDAEVERLASRLETRDADRARPTIVIVSHVGAWHPRAGNEYRLNRMLQWYRRRGYRVIPVIAPLAGEDLSREVLEGTAATFGNVIQVHRDGRIEHDLRDMPSLLAPLGATLPPPQPHERADSAPRNSELIKVDRTFCHDALISTVLQLQQSLGPHVLQVEYIWMSLLLPLVRSDVLKVIDTHDVFSTIEQKVRMFGVRDVAIDPEEEAERLRRADLVIAIQDEERNELQRLAPSIPVVTAGVDFDVVSDADGAADGRLLYVASSNARNCKGLRDFLRLAWPRIRRRLPSAELAVVGGVAQAVAGREPVGVTIVGTADDLTTLYREAAVVINPVVAGTGAKIKTIEALAHLRPVVTFPAGVDGLEARLATRCVIARDWYEFANLAVDALTASRDRQFTMHDRAVIAEVVSPEAIYAELDAAYAAYFESHRTADSPVTTVIMATPTGAHAD